MFEGGYQTYMNRSHTSLAPRSQEEQGSFKALLAKSSPHWKALALHLVQVLFHSAPASSLV